MLGPSTWYDWKTYTVSRIAINGAKSKMPIVDRVPPSAPFDFCGGCFMSLVDVSADEAGVVG